jgi:RHS repeat-associated protein
MLWFFLEFSYVQNNSGIFRVVYQFKDHLGNVRLTYSDSDLNGAIDPSTEIISEKNYYPFGLKHKGYNNVVSPNGNSVAQKKGFGGKEHQDELGLGWIDITARNYDPAIGRWMNIDPLGELLMSCSPFTYSLNNPIYYNDPTGMLPEGYSTNSDYYITDYYDDGKGKIVYDPNVGPGNVPSGGTYIGPTYTDPVTGTFWDQNGKSHNNTQTLDEIVIVVNSSSSNNKDKLLHIWGIGTGLEGNGQTGSGVSMSWDDITYGGGGAKTNSAFAAFLRYISNLFSTAENMKKVRESVILKPNESTMENRVKEEARNISEEVKEFIIISTYASGTETYTPVNTIDGAEKDSAIMTNSASKKGLLSIKIKNINNTKLDKYLDSVLRIPNN